MFVWDPVVKKRRMSYSSDELDSFGHTPPNVFEQPNRRRKVERIPPSLASFTLNLIHDGALLIRYDTNASRTKSPYRIDFINDALQNSITKTRQTTDTTNNNSYDMHVDKDFSKLEDILSFLKEEDLFLKSLDEVVKGYSISKTPRTIIPTRVFQKKSPERYGKYYSVSFSLWQPDPTDRLEDDFYICCIFKEEDERNQYLEAWSVHCPVRFTISELHEEKRNFLRLFTSQGVEDIVHSNDRIDGKYAFNDLADRVPPEQMKNFIDTCNELVHGNKKKEQVSLTVRGDTPDKDSHLLFDSIFLGFSKLSGNPYFLNMFVNDGRMRYSLRDHFLQEIEELNKILMMFFEHSPLWMGVIDIVDNDTDTIHIYANPSICKHMGLAPENFMGYRSVASLGTDAKLISDQWIPGFREAERKRSPNIFQVSPKADPTGLKVITVCGLHIKDNRFLYIAQDLTQHYEMEEKITRNQEFLEEQVKARTKELEEALQVKSRFLAIMSHEIRTPLSGILGSLTLLESSELVEEQLELVKISQVCGEQLSAVINDILDLSKMEENRMSIEAIPFQLSTLLEDALEVVSFDAKRKDLELVFDSSDDLPDTIIGDQTRLRQIVVNLLSNAVKFSNKGEIVLRASVTKKMKGHEVKKKQSTEIIDPNRNSFVLCSSSDTTDINLESEYYILQFSVQDSGIGIKEEAKETLFQPFTQGDSSTTRKYGGSGLGLSISKRLSELMKGKMWFESEEHKGSTFFFTIVVPIKETYVPPIIPITPAVPVLIVERNPVLSAVMKKRMAKWGFRGIIIPNEEDKLLSPTFLNNVEIILIDSNSNLNVINQAIDHRPVIVIGYNDQQHEYKQTVFHLRKPVRARSLYRLLHEVLAIRRGSKIENSSAYQEKSKEVIQSKVSLEDKQKLRILLAEDNPLNQKIITKLLERAGFFNIVVVTNGLEVLSQLEKGYFDVIFMDVMMPELGGIEATLRIREMKLETQPAIIGLTANAFLENKERCLSSGMDNFLTKPVQVDDMTRVLEFYTINKKVNKRT